MRWWRVFLDKLTGKHTEPDATGPRRRSTERFQYEAKLSVKCASWPDVLDLFTSDVSAGGMFIPTTRDAMIGDTIELEIELPEGAPLALTGTVVNVLDPEKAVEHRKPPGLGVQLDPMSEDTARRFSQVVEAARGDQPVPDPGPAPVTPPPPAAPAVIRRPEDTIIGIDLGTTYTSVAAVIGKRVTILPWPDGANASPSVIAFPAAGEVLVGAEARERLATDPARTVTSPKRLLGRRYDDNEIQGFIGQAPYRTLAGPDGSVVIEMWREPYAVTQLCGYLLDAARKNAERVLGHRVQRCVVTCPVSFAEDRVSLIKRAGRMAMLDVVGMIDEPSAAALANRFHPGFGGTVGVYDFGGGTFDFSLVDVSRGDFLVLATAGDTWLGGDDFDTVIADAVANQFWRVHKVDLHTQTVEWQKLVFACERAKRLLSEANESLIHVPDVLRTAEGMVDLNITIDRATFERACASLINRSLETCTDALELLDMRADELSSIYLSGGTTRIPAVRAAVERTFGVQVTSGAPPEYAVCLGAAIHAAQLQFRGSTTLDEK